MVDMLGLTYCWFGGLTRFAHNNKAREEEAHPGLPRCLEALRYLLQVDISPSSEGKGLALGYSINVLQEL